MTPRAPAPEADSDRVVMQPSNLVDEQLLNAKALAESDAGKAVQSFVGRERFESVKTAVAGIVFGAVPEAVTAWLDPERLTPRWEFQLDMLALQILLFALVYRYAVREGDDNPMQKLGVLAAFVIPRALFMVQMPASCVAAPLNCGPPFGYFSWSMLAEVAKQLVIGGASIGGALLGLERAFAVGFIRRFCGGSLDEPEGPAQSRLEDVPPETGAGRFPWDEWFR